MQKVKVMVSHYEPNPRKKKEKIRLKILRVIRMMQSLLRVNTIMGLTTYIKANLKMTRKMTLNRKLNPKMRIILEWNKNDSSRNLGKARWKIKG